MIELLLGLGFLLTVGYGVIVAQIIALARLFRSKAWILIATALSLGGLRAIYSMLKLPSTLLRLAGDGKLPAELTIEQWILIGAGFLVIGLLIAGFDQLRRDLRHIGI